MIDPAWLLQLVRDLVNPLEHAFVPGLEDPQRCWACQRFDELHPTSIEERDVLSRRLRGYVEDDGA